MKNKVVKIVKLLTFNKVRGQNLSNVEPDLKWTKDLYDLLKGYI